MQSTNLQKDKLDLIDKILHTEDQSTLDFLKSILIDENQEFQLSDEQKTILEKATEKYYSGEEPSFTWEQVKINARKSHNEKKS
ncbi:addiction module protein [Flavobacterium cellulosilyticum]|uniref:Addiction module protein n=1 Tax=Flavobacterium cellulosilyticum TaxID=2541731 RepID=A0A4R5CG03_9FLAO|nr:addiction module protein [Flavobacterium cellulosilyticum]TDD97360.1 hypothetical protein E0F76_08575 [Flavobacterium cellulosilyticum]